MGCELGMSVLTPNVGVVDPISSVTQRLARQHVVHFHDDRRVFS